MKKVHPAPLLCNYCIILKCNIYQKSIWGDWNSGWSLIHSKNLGDLSLVIMKKCILIKCFYALMCLNMTHLKNSSIFKNTLSFIYCNKIGNFGGFPSCKFQEFVFYLRKLKISEVSKFSILALILKLKTRKTRKYFQDLHTSKNVLYLRKFLILTFILKSKNCKYFQDL